MKFIHLLIVVSFVFTLDLVQAEPWLANRYAQNCTACHAPGRLNRKPSKRRCTLSCQGCHVNPNGGGLRNQYGKWNEERFLRSFYTGLAWNKKSPAPLHKQRYFQKNLKQMAKSKKKKGKGKQASVRKLSKKQMLHYARFGAPLVEIPKAITDEDPYFESSNYTTARNKVEELSRMSRNDPYRVERRNMVTVGGDLRLFYLQRSEGAPAGSKLEEGTFFPMVFDFGVRVRPIKENLSFVYEGRVLNAGNLGPGGDPSSLDKLFGPRGAGINRSAYMLVDDLWYNSYLQVGFFRPMFGLYNPNHTAMINDYTNLDFTTSIKQVGFGLAPNVPFGIFNYILPSEGVGAGSISAEEGFNFTLGLRFVRLGAHAQLHYWQSEDDQGLNPRKRTMWNINGGVVLLDRRLIVNGELTNVRKEFAGLDETKILGVDVRGRIWREVYLTGGYAQANAAIAFNNTTSGTGISPGSGTETTLGIRGFWISGFETELLMSDKVNKEDGFADQKESTLSFQMHAFF